MIEQTYKDGKRWIVLGILCLSLFIIAIDNMVLNLALPSISKDLGASVSQLQWITDAYILVFASLLLTMGAIGDRYGRKRILQMGTLLFGIGSLTAALSTSTEMLITFRAFLGIGCATRPDWLDDRLRDGYFAKFEDIDALAKLARPFNKKMKGLYKEIRSRVFAHAIHTDEIVISNLFEGTKFEEIDNALTALWSIYSQVWQLYGNARQPTLEIETYPYKDEVEKCVRIALIGKF